jgi:uncharacterized membrane protein HdeD (DUF308 family)
LTSSGARAHTSPLPGPLAARGTTRITLAVAAAMLTLGMLLIFWPYASLVVIAVLLGIALLATGVLRLAHGVTAGGQAGTHRSAHLLIGILAVLAGIYCLGDIAGTVVLLSLVVGLFWVMHGLVDLVAIGDPGPGRALTGITGGLSLLAGLIVIFWPAITVPVMVAVMGAWLACDGLLLATTVLYLRRVTRAAAAARQPSLRLSRGLCRQATAPPEALMITGTWPFHRSNSRDHGCRRAHHNRDHDLGVVLATSRS